MTVDFLLHDKGVRVVHPQYRAMYAHWKKCLDAFEGEQAVHAAGTKYLPMLRREDKNDYEARLGRTPFFNAVGRTVAGMHGLLFRKPPTPSIPSRISEMVLDIDMAGTPLDLFAQQCAIELLKLGRFGVLVDYPERGTEGMTTAQAEAAGLRPMAALYNALSIRNWKFRRINGRDQLSLVVLEEDAILDSSDEFVHKSEKRYRVLDLVSHPDVENHLVYRQRVFKIDDQDMDVLIPDSLVYPMKANNYLDHIPFWVCSTDDLRPDVNIPPLMDVVNMNFHHYRVSADWEHACHLAGLPTFCVSGYSPTIKEDGSTDEISVGGLKALTFPDINSKAYYAETGSAFHNPLVKNLEMKQAQIAVLASRMLEERRPAVESGETQRQRSLGEFSQLATIAQTVSLCFEAFLTEFCGWAGSEEKVGYQINRDFLPSGMSPQMLRELLNSYLSGGISYESYFINLQRYDVINPDVTVEQEKERIKANPPLLSDFSPDETGKDDDSGSTSTFDSSAGVG